MTTDTETPAMPADEPWGVLRLDGTFIPVEGGRTTTPRQVAEAWVKEEPTFRALPASSPEVSR